MDDRHSLIIVENQSGEAHFFFSLQLTLRAWRRFAQNSKRVLDKRDRKIPSGECGKGLDTVMWSSILMLLGKPPGNEHFPGLSNCLRHDDDWVRSVRQDIWDA